MDLHKVPSDVCLAMEIYSPKQRNDDPLCGTDMLWTLSRWNSLGAEGLEVVEVGLPLYKLHPCTSVGQLE